MGEVHYRPPGLPYHVPADVDGIDFAEEARQRACDASCATADLQNLHASGIAALADISQIIADVFVQFRFAGFKELLVRPDLLAGCHIIAGILFRTPVPIAAHATHVSCDTSPQHLLYCNRKPEWA